MDMLAKLSPVRVYKVVSGAYVHESEWPNPVAINASLMVTAEKDTVSALLQMGQEHLFKDWDPPGMHDHEKHVFLKQASILITAGLEDYLMRARALLADSKNGENPFAGWTPSVPEGVTLVPENATEFEALEARGVPELGKCGFILVAGGLGERLGYNGIKVSLPTETLTRACYLELYCQQILHIQKQYASQKTKLPFAIMVSDDTHDKTLALLQAKAYFGLDAGQVTLIKQEKVAALIDNEAHIAQVNAYEIDTKPHGHGDVHALMHSSRTAEKWLKSGTRWVVFFQDTNGLCFLSLAAALGVSTSLELEVNSLAVPRKAKQAVGAITALKHESGSEMTVNVEYNQLDPLLRATVSPNGDVNDPITGLSPYPGNINQLIFAADSYVRNLKRSGGVMGEFVNPKYADATRSTFKKPTRLECMMQDYPKSLPAGSRVGFTAAPAWLCYSPCKNNSADAKTSVAAGVPAGCALTAESDIYMVAVELLRLLGVHISKGPSESFLGISAPLSPRVVLHPSFALFNFELAVRFPHPTKVSISRRSSLVVKGDVIIESLTLDGSLRLEAVVGSTLIVRAGKIPIVNAGHVIKKCTDDASEEIRMRGYVIEVISEEKVVTCDRGVFVFTGRALVTEAAYDPEDNGQPVSCFSCC